MRKILTIGGNDIAFECNAATPFIYKAEFRKDFFGELIKFSKALGGKQLDLDDLSYEDIDHANFNIYAQMAWACAKSADQKNTKPFLDWLNENPEFNLIEHGGIIAELVINYMNTKKK